MFGNIDGYEYLNNMYFCLQGGNDNSFHLAVGTGSGATRTQQVGGIEQGSDGLAMFYREVPAPQTSPYLQILPSTPTMHPF